MRAIGSTAAGALGGFAAAILVVFACDRTVGEPRDLGVAIMLGLAAVVAGAALGGVGGYFSWGRGRRP
jgi:peptidoglycan/LPS O-acetylase OafA/YrhL